MRTAINLNDCEINLNECEIDLDEPEIDLNESKINLNESEIDLNEPEHFLKANLDRSQIDLHHKWNTHGSQSEAALYQIYVKKLIILHFSLQIIIHLLFINYTDNYSRCR